uniref:IF rod domain-containing protein n=1 Tax=Otolemur garnettii TaxID=30611 RepID=H0XXT1_OTOGA
MSFTTRSTTFSSNYQTLGSVQVPSNSVQPARPAASIVYTGAGGSGSQISMSHFTSFWGSGGPGAWPQGMAGHLAGIGGMQTEETMQDLNDCLASYLDRVRNLKINNWRLESKIQEHLEKKGPQVRDWVHYFKTIEDLRAQIFVNSVDNAHFVLQIDNAHLAADDFRVKYETELAMCQSVESDISARSLMTPISLQLESEIKALKEELLFMKKNHKEEVKALQAQIGSSGLTMEVDAPKSQDLSRIMADMWAQYDELAQRRRAGQALVKTWSQQIQESTSVVTSQSAEVSAKTMLTELMRTVQSLEIIPLPPIKTFHTSLVDSLREVEARYAMQMEQLGVLLHLESEVAQTRAERQCQAQDYEALLNIKVKPEAEITTYHRLLEDGKDFNLGDALDSSSSMQTIQKTTTHRIVNSKVVSETNNTKVLRH